MSSLKPTLCLFCYQVVNFENVNLTSGQLRRLLRDCHEHLCPLLKGTISLTDIEKTKDCDLAMCECCLEGVRETIKISKELETCQKMMANSSIKFNLSTFKRRDNMDGRENVSTSTHHHQSATTSTPNKEKMASPGRNRVDETQSDILSSEISDFVLEYLPELPNQEDVDTLGGLISEEDPHLEADELLKSIGDQLTTFGEDSFKKETVEVKTEMNAVSNAQTMTKENINVKTEGLVVNPLDNIITANLKIEDEFCNNQEPLDVDDLLQNIGDQLTPFVEDSFKTETVEVKTERNAFSNAPAMTKENINVKTEGLVVNPLANIMTANLKIEDGFYNNQEPVKREVVEISSEMKNEIPPPSILIKTDETRNTIQIPLVRTSTRLLEEDKPVKVEERVAKMESTFDRTRLRPRGGGVSYFLMENGLYDDSKDTVKTKLNKLDNKSGRILKESKTSRICCGVCNRILTTKQGWESHKRTHTGEKPYRCSICYKGYVSKSGLKYHEKRCPQT